jgi:hypothetical protein
MKRVDSVNRVYEELAKKFSIIEIKARDIKGVEDRKNWHVDRLHPGPRGHLLLARAAIQELSRRGLPVTEISISDPVEPSLSEKVRWMLLKGTPWFVKRSFDLLPVALFLMLREMINPSKFPQVCLEATLEGYDSSSAKEKEFTLV